MASALAALSGRTLAGSCVAEGVYSTAGAFSFTAVLQHSGTLTRGAQHLVISVVPDSGTDQLTGLSGTMSIQIAGGKHFYDFEYTLPANR
jgi:Protein of unknown function (DUF3224)